ASTRTAAAARASVASRRHLLEQRLLWRRRRQPDQPLGGEAVGDQDVDQAALERAADRLDLLRGAGHADGARNAPQLRQREPDHALAEPARDGRPGGVEEAEADVADGAEPVELVEL